MEKEKVKQMLILTYIKPLSYIQLALIMLTIISVFMFIWVDFKLAIKLFITGIVAEFIVYIIKRIIKKAIDEVVNEEFKDNKIKLTFEQRINEKAKK